MTEAEWLAGSNLREMLDHIRNTGSDRKLRLLACACCRRAWHLLTDLRSQEAVTLSEAYADGQVDKASLRLACQRAWEAMPGAGVTSSAEGAAQVCSEEYRAYPLMAAGILEPLAPQESKTFPRLLHCIFGNPFHLVPLDPAWRTADAVRLAQAAYEDRSLPAGSLDSDRLSLLADALEEAGCTDRSILDHCRSPGLHVRGCWPLDLVLNKS
jgi:hypothetical protein